jgi:hypothetical protein
VVHVDQHRAGRDPGREVAGRFGPRRQHDGARGEVRRLVDQAGDRAGGQPPEQTVEQEERTEGSEWGFGWEFDGLGHGAGS